MKELSVFYNLKTNSKTKQFILDSKTYQIRITFSLLKKSFGVSIISICCEFKGKIGEFLDHLKTFKSIHCREDKHIVFTFAGILFIQ